MKVSNPSTRPMTSIRTAGPFLTLRLLAVLAGFLAAAGVQAQTQFQGWCSQVKIQIVQELALERIGFEATLTVTNNDGADAITDFSAELSFEDPAITAPGADNNAAPLFFVRQPELENINRIDGTGVIAPTKTAIVKWFIIPTIGAGGTQPQGRRFSVGCNLGGKLQGVDIPASNMFAIPDTITVKPNDSGSGSVVTYDAVLKLKGPLALADPLLSLSFKKIGDRAGVGLVAALAGERVPTAAQ